MALLALRDSITTPLCRRLVNGRYNQTVPYPEPLIAAMRHDLTRYGVEEARTPQEVNRLLGPDSGAVLMIVNSVCGCAAGRARPAVGLALQHAVRPSKVATVFAGGDEAAVALED